ncbi:MAG: UTP--glucose-1-phosphate uridylyltransferase [Candidatus Berkelbacteria bacterium]|nr:UTP--glucose-1-phosphate uridylyltransferase [Candidatus Berkelbacteria bacterium]
MKKIRKAVIPAAGYGTRFLPVVKSIPKEMLPVVDKPVIQYIVEEAVASGIEDIIIVTGSNKRAIEDYFDHSLELEHYLEKNGKTEQLEQIKKIARLANFIYVRQKGPYGNGTPVLNAEHIIGDEPFAVLWGDQFTSAPAPRLKQLIDVFEKHNKPVISAVRIENKSHLSRYGVPAVEKIEEYVYKVSKLIEKPAPEEAPSDLALDGAYVLPPEIFEILHQLKPGKGGELWLADAIDILREKQGLLCCEVEGGKYHDCGNVFEFLKTNIETGLLREDIKEEFRRYLKEIVEKN